MNLTEYHYIDICLKLSRLLITLGIHSNVPQIILISSLYPVLASQNLYSRVKVCYTQND